MKLRALKEARLQERGCLVFGEKRLDLLDVSHGSESLEDTERLDEVLSSRVVVSLESLERPKLACACGLRSRERVGF
jgi:hypothetical protein